MIEVLGGILVILFICALMFFFIGVCTMGSVSEAWRIITEEFFSGKKCKKCGCKKGDN